MSLTPQVRRPTFKFYALIIAVIVSLLFFAPVASAQGRTATISIPSINVQAPVLEIYVRAFADGSVTWDTNGLQNNVGHLEGTSWFGEAGNTVLAGHSELAARQPSVFVSLNQVKTGDVIVIDENGSQKQYAVTSVSQVDTTDLAPVYPTSDERLTLITCDTTSFTGNDIYTKRLIVVAQRIG